MPQDPTPNSGPDSALAAGVAETWRAFLTRYEPLKPQLYRYCCHLTQNPWDAEDLVQDALARAYTGLSGMQAPPDHPQAWLFRVASNLWIDEVRRRTVRSGHAAQRQDAAEQATSPGTQALREAAGTLLTQLAPQERAAVMLKDAFDFSLDEIAEILSTTVGAVKTALHRGRGKLAAPAPAVERLPAPGVLDAFCKAFNARDLDTLASLLLDNATVEVVGATVLQGAETARTTVLWGMVFGSKHMAALEDGGVGQRFDAALGQGVLPTPARLEIAHYRGAPVLLSFYEHHDGEYVRAVTRLELSEDGSRVARLRNYFYTPEVIVDVCEELGLPHRENGIYIP